MRIDREGGLVWLYCEVGGLRLKLPFRTELEARSWWWRRGKAAQ